VIKERRRLRERERAGKIPWKKHCEKKEYDEHDGDCTINRAAAKE